MQVLFSLLSTHLQISLILFHYSVDEWLVKGGTSLKTLAAILVRRQAALDQLSSRAEVAASYLAAAEAVLNGKVPHCLPDEHAFADLALEA